MGNGKKLPPNGDYAEATADRQDDWPGNYDDDNYDIYGGGHVDIDTGEIDFDEDSASLNGYDYGPGIDGDDSGLEGIEYGGSYDANPGCSAPRIRLRYRKWPVFLRIP